MGEIAEMMIDGTMCAGCGEFLNDGEDGPGYPCYCSSCQPEGAAARPAGQGKKERRRRKRKRQREKKIQKLVDTARAGELDSWKKCSVYHYQKEIDGILVNWWPSTMKCMFNGVVYAPIGSEKDILNFIKKAGVKNDK